MLLHVEYLQNPDDPRSLCWRLLPLAMDLERVKRIARDGLPDVRDYLGAQGFRILNTWGDVVAAESVSAGNIEAQQCAGEKPAPNRSWRPRYGTMNPQTSALPLAPQ